MVTKHCCKCKVMVSEREREQRFLFCFVFFDCSDKILVENNQNFCCNDISQDSHRRIIINNLLIFINWLFYGFVMFFSRLVI